MTLGCGRGTVTRSGSDKVNVTRRPDRLDRQIIGGIVSAVVCFAGAVAFKSYVDDEPTNVTAFMLSLVCVLGFLISLLFVAIVLVAAAVRFVLNDYWPNRDWLR